MAELILTPSGEQYGDDIRYGGTSAEQTRAAIIDAFDRNGGHIEESNLMNEIRDEVGDEPSSTIRSGVRYLLSKGYLVKQEF